MNILPTHTHQQCIEIDIVQRYLAAFSQNNTQAALQHIHEKAVWHIDGDPIVKTVGILYGHQQIKQWLDNFTLAFKALAFSISKIVSDATDVFVIGRFRHLIITTQTIVDSDYIIKFSIKDNKIIRYQIFEDSLLLSNLHRTSSHSRQITINHCTYSWDDIGQGKPIIFLHGLFLDRHFWTPVIQSLPTYRCIAFDMPGHAQSTWRHHLDLDGIAEDLVVWLQENAIQKATFVGHSQGAMVAMRIAARHPELIDKLLLVNTSAREEATDKLTLWHKRHQILISNQVQKAELFKAMQKIKYSEAYLHSHPQHIKLEFEHLMSSHAENLALALQAATINRLDIRHEIKQIQATTYVLSGALDVATPEYLGQEIADLIPQAIYQKIDHASHSIPVECPEAISNLLINM
ncbi:alpha/beta fold hydrolase [Acinetobacter rudis]|uniref:alpha/beta fold hydrolase n=1 Tax=Acinetobacter rudis TaxID=632955 RepID=UPI00280E047B|nr:alpha/beta fold hydrolase [Acinetobacter rudis]MDQ8952147.1 alpha/beta fold hydrolase [Acinetobacter rudis]